MPVKDEDFFKRRDDQFGSICEASNEVFQEKNRYYHDAISRTGVLGAAVEIVGVSARLEPMIINNPHFEEKMDDPKFRASLLNIIHDLHNYSNILGMMLDDKNWRGE